MNRNASTTTLEVSTMHSNRVASSATQPVQQHFSQTVREVAKTMRAAVIAAPGQIRIEEVTTPSPKEHEVLVQMEGCGVCGSNLPLWEGREWFDYPQPPGKPGHEGWGRVAQVGPDVQGVTVGDRVATLSQNAYAEYDIGDSRALVVLPEELDEIPFPGEPLACANNVFARCAIAPGDAVAIVGIGFLGALLTQLAVEAGAAVIAISRREFALSVAEQVGAQYTIPLHDHGEIFEQVQDITNGCGCDCVIEAVGKQEALDLASQLPGVRGRLVIAGYHQDGMRQVNMQMWNWRGLDVINAHEREQHIYVAGLQAALAAVMEGRLNPQILYTHAFPLEELDKALTIMSERPEGFMKALITL